MHKELYVITFIADVVVVLFYILTFIASLLVVLAASFIGYLELTGYFEERRLDKNDDEILGNAEEYRSDFN
jgi:hypothetical protein